MVLKNRKERQKGEEGKKREEGEEGRRKKEEKEEASPSRFGLRGSSCLISKQVKISFAYFIQQNVDIAISFKFRFTSIDSMYNSSCLQSHSRFSLPSIVSGH